MGQSKASFAGPVEAVDHVLNIFDLTAAAVFR